MYENPNQPLLYPPVEQRWICPTCNSDKNTQVVLNTCGHIICHVCYSHNEICSLCEVKQVDIEAMNVEEVEEVREIKQGYEWRVNRLHTLIFILTLTLITIGCLFILFYPFNVREYTKCNILNCTMTNEICINDKHGKYNCIDYDIIIELGEYNKTIEYISERDIGLCNDRVIICHYDKDNMEKTLNIDVEG